MKKTAAVILTLTLLLGLFPAALGPVTAKANTYKNIVKTLYENAFETNPFKGSWTSKDADGDGHDWTFFTSSSAVAHSGNGAMMSRSYDDAGHPLFPNNWLVSPYIDIPLTGYTYIGFWAKGMDADRPEECFNISYIDKELPGAPTVLSQTCTTGGEWNSYVFDLTQFAGRTISIVIAHTQPESAFNHSALCIDDFLVDNHRSVACMLDEDFETDPFDRGWEAIEYDGDGFNWDYYYGTGSQGRSHGGNGSVFSLSYDEAAGKPLETIHWLYSPYFTVPEDDWTTLRFWAREFDPKGTKNDYFRVAYKVQGGTNAYVITDTTKTAANWKEYTVDLTGLAGKTVQLVFIHSTYNGYQLLLDDISVTNEKDPYGIYSYDFEEDPFLNGWTRTDADGDGIDWFWSHPVPTLQDGTRLSRSGTGAVCSESFYDTKALTPNNWLTSPFFDVPAEGETTVYFWARGSATGADAEKFNVSYLIYGEPQIPTVISETFTSKYEWQRFSVTLPDNLKGKRVRVTIAHCDCTDMYRLYLDDFYVRCVPPEKADVMKGDMDKDGEITVADALMALRIAAKLADASDEAVAVGDVDADGSITVADALAILRVAAKLADQSSLG
ncbi:MAG: choice-of-anchor J domain-containing protein [Clostridia bacterium]|nr:choice-of-anchor J domain-containing protein [Clostridia bacterium]